MLYLNTECYERGHSDTHLHPIRYSWEPTAHKERGACRSYATEANCELNTPTASGAQFARVLTLVLILWEEIDDKVRARDTRAAEN